ncbi:MAG: universal stress protein [Deltaproteobacteria bacterium]|nr:universal stress protein [Deltaproteobacteria bacterium]
MVHTDHDKRCAVRIEAAIRMAKQHDAHLIALYTQTPFVLPGYLMQAGQKIDEAQQKAAAEAMAMAKAVYNNQVSSMGFKNTEWRSTINFPVDALTMQARYADLVVVGQRDQSENSDINKDIPAQLVLAACRPVLILPYIGSFLSIGRRILVAWNASREATRAITDALPLLKRADSVNLIALCPKHDSRELIPVDDIVHYLARHGVMVEVLSDHVADSDVGNVLLSRSAELNADLLIMGGYGHSRLREWVLGGATRTMLDSMTLPVLMSH